MSKKKTKISIGPLIMCFAISITSPSYAVNGGAVHPRSKTETLEGASSGLVQGLPFKEPLDLAGAGSIDPRFNGHFVTESSELEVFCYTLGIIECAYKLKPFEMAELYSDTSKSGIIRSVKDYYKNNPSEIDRPVIDVVLAGCKKAD